MGKLTQRFEPRFKCIWKLRKAGKKNLALDSLVLSKDDIEAIPAPVTQTALSELKERNEGSNLQRGKSW